MIGVNAFQSNIKMKNLLLPNGLQEISTNAFRCSKALREVALPHSIYRVGNGCFAECPSLRVAYLSRWPGRNFRGSVPGRPTAAKSPLPETVK
ncbi:MAG: leucine-rich repeat protein [Lachnospiraceae bacterium]